MDKLGNVVTALTACKPSLEALNYDSSSLQPLLSLRVNGEEDLRV